MVVRSRAAFERVERYYFEDETRFDRAYNIVDVYLTLRRYKSVTERPDIDETTKGNVAKTVGELAQNIIERDGALRSPVLMGAFVCRNPLIG